MGTRYLTLGKRRQLWVEKERITNHRSDVDYGAALPLCIARSVSKDILTVTKTHQVRGRKPGPP
jgi:hypothetical protein